MLHYQKLDLIWFIKQPRLANLSAIPLWVIGYDRYMLLLESDNTKTFYTRHKFAIMNIYFANTFRLTTIV